MEEVRTKPVNLIQKVNLIHILHQNLLEIIDFELYAFNCFKLKTTWRFYFLVPIDIISSAFVEQFLINFPFTSRAGAVSGRLNKEKIMNRRRQLAFGWHETFSTAVFFFLGKRKRRKNPSLMTHDPKNPQDGISSIWYSTDVSNISHINL